MLSSLLAKPSPMKTQFNRHLSLSNCITATQLCLPAMEAGGGASTHFILPNNTHDDIGVTQTHYFGGHSLRSQYIMQAEAAYIIAMARKQRVG